ncbi:MAG: hypothetical protein L0Z70_03640 [Chloroflexi bacterium]|nr:hypothetical protein [Chloroflexota bacterium]
MLLQSQSTALHPLTTAHLATTMTLMSLTAEELFQKIEAELAANPALELGEERRCPTCRRALVQPGPCPVCSRPSGVNQEEPIVFVSSREDFYSPRRALGSDELPADELAAEEEDLPAYVMRQIAPDLAAQDRRLAAHILTSLDEDGLLTVPPAEIARYHHTPLSRVEAVLRLIQRADPVGVGSPTPQEALLVQIEALSESRPVPPLAARAVQEGMALLSRRRYAELSRLLGVSLSQAREIAVFISDNLNPFPGRAHWGGATQAPQPEPQVYTNPDILINQLNNQANAPLVVEVISPLAGKLRLNPLFRQALHDAPPEKIPEWQAALEQASLLIKCLQQRNHTMVRLMERLSVLQRQFILQGDAYLKPLTRASLAVELDVHESTISRAVAGKAVKLPSGRIIPMDKLFDRSLHIRTELRQIIAQEGRPMTDTQIATVLKERGYPVARRTVAKYRAMEGILPAHLRQPVGA